MLKDWQITCPVLTCNMFYTCRVIQGWTPGCAGITVHWVYTSTVNITAVLCSNTWWSYQVWLLFCSMRPSSAVNITCSPCCYEFECIFTDSQFCVMCCKPYNDQMYSVHNILDTSSIFTLTLMNFMHLSCTNITEFVFFIKVIYLHDLL